MTTDDSETTTGATDVEPTVDEPTAGELAAPESAAASVPTHTRRARILLPALLALMLAVASGFAAWSYVTQYRPDQQTDAAVAETVVKAASDGAVAMLSYAPPTMDKDFAAAKSHLTGDFVKFYTDFTNNVVTRAVKEKDVKTQAKVVRAAISDLSPESALVLAFINQTTVSKDNPDGTFAQSSVKISMKKVDGAWLIAAFDPV
ncbi:twin-arginine translocation pathway signal [Mycolicibacterium sp. HS_4_1]